MHLDEGYLLFWGRLSHNSQTTNRYRLITLKLICRTLRVIATGYTVTCWSKVLLNRRLEFTMHIDSCIKFRRSYFIFGQMYHIPKELRPKW